MYFFLHGCWTSCTLSLLWSLFLETHRSTFLELFPEWWLFKLSDLGSLMKNIHLLYSDSLRSSHPPLSQYSDLKPVKNWALESTTELHKFKSWRSYSHFSIHHDIYNFLSIHWINGFFFFYLASNRFSILPSDEPFLQAERCTELKKVLHGQTISKVIVQVFCRCYQNTSPVSPYEISS